MSERPARTAPGGRRRPSAAKRASTAVARRAARVHVTATAPFSDLPKRLVLPRVERMLCAAGAPLAEVSLALVDDEHMTELCARWMGKTETTDVLSFPLHERPLVALAESPAIMLGDIVLSVPVVRKQARRAKREVLDEATMLLAHGILHLLGFDHRTAREEHEMFAYGRLLEAAAVAKPAFSLQLSPRNP